MQFTGLGRPIPFPDTRKEASRSLEAATTQFLVTPWNPWYRAGQERRGIIHQFRRPGGPPARAREGAELVGYSSAGIWRPGLPPALKPIFARPGAMQFASPNRSNSTLWHQAALASNCVTQMQTRRCVQ